jgi:tRNA(Ile2) C34 agmatinyltransferase TiaS
MTHGATVQRIAGRIPQELRELRGKLMIEALCETLGVEEVDCPACGGSGRLDGRRHVRCPVCCGFREVPDQLADWFRAELAGACADREAPPGAGRRRAAPPAGERYGRLAERPRRVHLPGRS